MRNVARLSLSRLAPVFWGGAVGLVALVIIHPEWSFQAGRAAITGLILLTGAAIGGSVCHAIEKTAAATAEVTAEQIHCGCLNLMADALVAATQQNDDDPETGTCGIADLRVVPQ